MRRRLGGLLLVFKISAASVEKRPGGLFGGTVTYSAQRGRPSLVMFCLFSLSCKYSGDIESSSRSRFAWFDSRNHGRERIVPLAALKGPRSICSLSESETMVMSPRTAPLSSRVY